MQKFLIIIKFLSVQESIRFLEQYLTGRLTVPVSKPLPDFSNIILKLIMPGVEESILISGNNVSGLHGSDSNPGMTIDIEKTLSTDLPAIKRKLSVCEHYQNIPGITASEPENTAADPGNKLPFPDELTGIEMEIADDEIQALENRQPLEKNGTQSRSSLMGDDTEYDLMNLRMENESDDEAVKVDLAGLSDFELMEDDELMLEEENTETADNQFASQPELAEVSLEFSLLSDDEDSTGSNAVDRQTTEPEPAVSETLETGGVLFDDLKIMVEQGEYEFVIEEEPEPEKKRIPEKKDLTPEEREKAEPVGQFFMNLTKAILRSGYYAPGHPGADTAKAGLYDEFIDVLGGQREIMVTNHNSRDGIDLMLTGILDEPISIRILVGAGVAELFVPKLSEYCERKQLLSFALKKDIAADHFYQFIDIMSDPKIDDHKDREAGKYLTNAFIEHGITDISTVFVDDMVKLESDLPWRVEMAIHRLAKDLKVMPMFKGVSIDAIKKMKLQTVQDIIRPLKHPVYLNDFLVNCYIIAEYVKSMAPEEIEEIVVEAFSIDLLLPTSRFTFQELDHLKQLKKEHPDNVLIDRRLKGIKRILKLISRRVVVENKPGTHSFLEQLYRNNILRFNELPADVQYMINTMKMADDIRDNFDRYIHVISKIQKPYEAIVYLKSFRRAVPALIDSDDWKVLSRLTQAVKKVSAKGAFISDSLYAGLKIIKSNEMTEDYAKSRLFATLDPSERPLGFIFKDVAGKMMIAYERADVNQRKLIDKILNSLGALGVEIISSMLTDSNNREVRKLSYELMISKGDQARKWAINVLEEDGFQWFIHRNALMILAKVSQKEGDFACVRKFFVHSNPKIREEALNAAVALKPGDGESLVLNLIDDEDPKVRWRALRTIQHFSPISESSMHELINIIRMPIPKNSEDAESQMNKTVHIISAINAMPTIPIPRNVESGILELLASLSGGKTSIWNKVKRAVGNDHETPVLKAAIPLLGKIGGDSSRNFLKKTIRSHPDLSEIIKKSLLKIKS